MRKNQHKFPGIALAVISVVAISSVNGCSDGAETKQKVAASNPAIKPKPETAPLVKVSEQKQPTSKKAKAVVKSGNLAKKKTQKIELLTDLRGKPTVVRRGPPTKRILTRSD